MRSRRTAVVRRARAASRNRTVPAAFSTRSATVTPRLQGSSGCLGRDRTSVSTSRASRPAARRQGNGGAKGCRPPTSRSTGGRADLLHHGTRMVDPGGNDPPSPACHAGALPVELGAPASRSRDSRFAVRRWQAAGVPPPAAGFWKPRRSLDRSLRPPSDFRYLITENSLGASCEVRTRVSGVEARRSAVELRTQGGQRRTFRPLRRKAFSLPSIPTRLSNRSSLRPRAHPMGRTELRTDGKIDPFERVSLSVPPAFRPTKKPRVPLGARGCFVDLRCSAVLDVLPARAPRLRGFPIQQTAVSE